MSRFSMLFSPLSAAFPLRFPARFRPSAAAAAAAFLSPGRASSTRAAMACQKKNTASPKKLKAEKEAEEAAEAESKATRAVLVMNRYMHRRRRSGSKSSIAMYRKVYLLRSGRYLFGPEILRSMHMDMENLESLDADADASATDASLGGDMSEMLMPHHGLFHHLQDVTDPYESMFLGGVDRLGAKHDALDLDEDDAPLCDFYVDYRLPTIMQMQQQQQQQQQQQRSPHMMFRQQHVPRSISNSSPDRSRTAAAAAAQQVPLPPPPLIKTPGNTELDRLEQPNDEELSRTTSPTRESPWVELESLQRPVEVARKPEEDQLFEHLVTTMAMPRKGSLGSLSRPVVKRLRNYFKQHVPKCPQCGTSEKVAFRYFNNFKKTSFLQPRYICKHPRHPIATSKREFACPTASQMMRAHCLDDPRDRFGGLPNASLAYRLISDSEGDAGLHLRL